MTLPRELQGRLTQKFGPVIDLRKRPEVLEEIADEVRAELQTSGISGGTTAPPFGVSWMDSWVAHWVYSEALQAAEARNREVAAVLRSLVDLKFNERLAEMREFVRDYGHVAESPDAGPPEPGTPPAGPARFTAPDAGPPEPGSPPAGPARFDAPDGGTPEPGVPPTGPAAGFLSENPWILYWFISIKAPLLLDVIDAHMTRRMHELRTASR
jgi:hypothetical protein